MEDYKGRGRRSQAPPLEMGCKDTVLREGGKGLEAGEENLQRKDATEWRCCTSSESQRERRGGALRVARL